MSWISATQGLKAPLSVNELRLSLVTDRSDGKSLGNLLSLGTTTTNSFLLM